MPPLTKNQLVQIILLIVWITIIINEGTNSVSSQTCTIPAYGNPIQIWIGSWAPSTRVSVKMDEAFSPSESAGLQAGTETWNNPVIACSGVTFNDFDPTTFEDYEDLPPQGQMYFQKDDPGGGPDARAFGVVGFGGFLEAARIKVHPNMVNIAQGTLYTYTATHEIGHTFNLNNCVSTNGCPTGTEATIMRTHSDGITSSNTFNTSGPKACDLIRVRDIYCAPSPTPTPTPTPEWPWPVIPTEPEPCQNGGWFWNFTNNTCNQDPQEAYCPHHCIPYQPLEQGACSSAADYCSFAYGCPPGTIDGGQGCCCLGTPVLVDINGDGFKLTDAYSGIMFDLGGDGRKEPIAWTRAGTDDAWLVLDRNGNGMVDSGKEMFGNFTDQPTADTTRNGFVALAEFDRAENGGNGDGLIRKNDSIFSSLRLWQDVNKNGISEPSELHSLKNLGLKTLELYYKESKRTDQHGNRFAYRAKVKDNKDAQMGRWAWDVILLANPPRR